MGKASKQQAAVNRQAVVAAASRVFRAKGVAGSGLREVMAAAGMTQGAFSGQFASKDELAAEACTHAFAGAEAAFATGLADATPGRFARLVTDYLGRQPAERSCPLTTLSIDSARAGEGDALRAAFSQGFGRLATLMAGDPIDEDRLLLLGAMVGAAMLGRAAGDHVLAERLQAATLAFADRLDVRET